MNDNRKHIEYVLHTILSEIGPIYEARRKSDGSLMVRCYSTQQDCINQANSMTEDKG